jgi:hypothetical protein
MSGGSINLPQSAESRERQMKLIILVASTVLIGLAAAGPAAAKGDASLEKKCKRMLQGQLGVERQPEGKGRRGKTGGGAAVYYTQIQNCVANGGRL